MDIPLWGRLALLALAALQIFGSLRSSWAKARSGQRDAARTDARLDLADGFAGTVLLLGLAFGQLPVAVCGFAVQGPILATQLIRRMLLRGKRAGVETGGA
ncbi:hypothetical protein PV721_02025 [Streptomyces sp. MB09-01]|uniref:hypothetical protein n=1 Tax=Streptomyces sp. MB09-01 TaxID=3028666 RepID=UPI0029A2A63E|nr:hypothetical protein [Streptomyces sp. MB09-01]MDX3533163.1 hypothetical protein [Streptomyces sp. MB09-01]